MANNVDQTGAIQINGSWATSVRYAAAALGPDANTVDLRFLREDAEVGRAVVERDKLADVLGEQNRRSIERHLADDANKYLSVVSGELRGAQLRYQNIIFAKSQDLDGRPSVSQEGRVERRSDSLSATTAPLDAPDREGHDRGAQETPARASSNGSVPVPAHIAAKYLVQGNTYHFDDRTAAFVDKGTSLTVHTHNKAIIQDLIAIAKARDWHSVKVSGTREFRREAWSAAAAAGISVNGYSPSEIERMAAARAGTRRDYANSAETSPQAAMDAPTDRARPGGTALTRDQEVAAAIRSATTTREELQLKYPEVNQAVFQHLASHDQFAQAYVKSGLIRESDRAQVIAQMRERLAAQIERGAVIREPDNKEVSTLIRRSVNRVAADIGRPAVEIQPRTIEMADRSGAREDVQVRA
jgi:hypothetical protein